MRCLAALFLMAVLTGPALGQSAADTAPPTIAAGLPPASDASLEPADAPEGRYILDPRHASVIWRVRHTGVGVFVARFDTARGALDFNPAAPETSRLEAAVAANSVNTGVLNGDGARAFDADIAAMLGADETPEIRFVLESAVRGEGAKGVMQGQLTMNGRTRPAAFEVTFQGGRFVQLRGKHVLAFSARTVIDRRDWGVGNLLVNRFAGDAVEILVEGEFVKE